MNKLFPVLILATILLTYTIVTQEVYAASKSKEKKYEQKIDKAIKSEAKKFSNVCTVGITTKQNNQTVQVYNKSSSQECKTGIPIPPPEPPKNKPPVIMVKSPVQGKINETVLINATVSDPDGNITQIHWDQQKGIPVNFTQLNNMMSFVPQVNGTYIFSVAATDNNASITSKMVTVKVGTIVVPPPNPPPTHQGLKVIMVGDLSGTAVLNQIKKENADLVVALGDLGYQSSLSWFKQNYGQLGNQVACLQGNHESSNEDGSSSIEQETQVYCGNDWYIKKGSILFLGFNSNGDLNGQAQRANNLLTDTNFMTNISSVHIMTHKPCAIPPNSHHGLEITSFCDAIKASIPNNVKAFFDSGHNHVMSASADGQYKQVGSGGKSHYTCGTNTQFPFCDNAHYGFLEYNIDTNGNTTWKFIDANGGVVN